MARTWRVMTPRAPSSFKRWERTFAETGGMSARNSLNRRGPARTLQITFGAHAPAMMLMHSVSLHGSGGCVLAFFRIFSGMTCSLVSRR